VKYIFLLGTIGGGIILFLGGLSRGAETLPSKDFSTRTEFSVEETSKTTGVFVGDIMPGRYVETLSERFGYDYLLASTTEIFSEADFVFGNLEGPVPLFHEKTPVYGYGFSFPFSSLTALKKVGISVASLGNNHAFDQGKVGYSETVLSLQKSGISGIPYNGAIVGEWGKEEIRFVALNDTFSPVTESEINRLIPDDEIFTVVSVHWGLEYEPLSAERQKKLGRAFIDAGADLVIGTHPHVVQEIEVYKGKPIFYSLGNFLFDQYFSEETEEGLAVKMTIDGKNVSYGLMPVDLRKSHPQKMKGVDAEKFLKDLSLRVDATLSSDIRKGFIILSR